MWAGPYAGCVPSYHPSNGKAELPKYRRMAMERRAPTNALFPSKPKTNLNLKSNCNRLFLHSHNHSLRFSVTVSASQDPNRNSDQQQLDLSVLRFTFGIPGFDESYLPRWIGVTFGGLIVANHFLSASSPSPAQLRTEALGVCLAAFSTALPYIGKFLKGANPVDRASIPEGNTQIFVISQNLSPKQEEDLAWATYVLLRNTNTMSVAIVVQDVSCLRGYWDVPETFSKPQILEWFRSQVQQVGFMDLEDSLYFPQIPDSRLQSILPKGVASLLIQPFHRPSNSSDAGASEFKGFVLLASNAKYAYSDRDRDWIKTIGGKFQDFQLPHSDREGKLNKVVIS